MGVCFVFFLAERGGRGEGVVVEKWGAKGGGKGWGSPREEEAC